MSNFTELNNDPLVRVYKNVITPEECEHFINISKNKLQRALVSMRSGGLVSKGRTGSNAWIKHNHDTITQNVANRISKIVNMPLENAESFQIIYYGVTQEYRNHYDSWEHDGSEKTLRCMKYGGARLVTVLCYLNNVKKGGGTHMTKLDITIPAKKGNMLLFHNTISLDNHNRHILSEHAGMPIEEGEKYAFNLWFRESNYSVLYKKVNYKYYKRVTEKDELVSNKEDIVSLPNVISEVHKYERLHTYKDIFKIKSYINKSSTEDILIKCEFNNRERRDGWVGLSSVSELVKKLENTTGINASFYENINIIEYKENVLHNKHFNAYDLNNDTGKKYTKTLGQRIFTITLSLTDNLTINFPNINSSFNFNQGDLLLYKNVMNNSMNRDSDLQRSIICNKGIGFIANIYIRCNNKTGETLTELGENTGETSNTELENYMSTLDNVLNKFYKNEITQNWGGLKSFKYNFKGDFYTFKKYISRYNDIRFNNNVLNQENLNVDYILDQKLPIQVVNNVLNIDILDLLKEYYQETINKNVWVLGDRQSNRYKAHNEPMSRFLHYECLPLIERIVGKSMKPTYTYLSLYVKGADLPPHTDRPDCEYTVSFVVDKPEGSNWNIYVHKPQQEVKYRGRYDDKPPLEECENVDCDVGGLMLFQGTDHIHFREELKCEYYNILLLHYCSV